MKDLKISTELASEVLGFKVVYIESCDHRDSIIGIWTDLNSKPLIEINIYEFAFKCKEWALSKGSYINCFYNAFWGDRIEKKYTADIPNKRKSFYEDTEIEAIIKACEWILGNRCEK